MEGAPPYAPFIEMLEHCARFVDREAFRQWLGDSAAEVSRLLPGLRQMFVDIPPTVEVPSDQQRRMLFDAFRGFFERSARSRPVVAVFEDLHWADEATVLLFRHLAQLISSIPLLLIATYRSAESDVSRPLTRALEDVYRDRSATRFILRSLSLPAVAAILDQLSGQTAPGWLVHFVFEHTEGNPFFVEELFLDLLLHGKLFDEQGSWRNAFEIGSFNVPQGVRLLIRNRLERLGGNTQRILSLAAILGRSFQIRVLEELEATSSETVLDALDEAERAQLIAPDEPEREPKYHFVHELVRQTLIESSSAPRRQRLHAQVANALERLCADKGESHASALAHHYYEAGAAVHVRQTIAYLVMAARVASASAAHEDALAHIERALSLARSDGLPEVSRLIASKAGVLRSLSRMDEAIDAYESAIHLFSEAGNFAEAAEASHALGHIHLWRADPARARAVVSRGLRVHGMSAPLCRYRLELLNAVSLGMKGDMEAAFEALEKAKEIEPAGPDSSPEIIGYARMCEAHLCYFAARLQTAGECARAAIAAFRQTGNIWAEVEAYEAMSDAVFDDRSGAETEAALSDVLVRAQRIGNQNAIWTYRFMLAELLMHQGRASGRHGRLSITLSSLRLHITAVTWQRRFDGR
jgi:tetratricopeptide (TPR) repeat protein